MIKYYPDLIQGSDEWMEARRGILTASEMKLIITPTFRVADNDRSRMHMWELLGQRLWGHVELHYISDDMMRGLEVENQARELYAQHRAPVTQMGFVTNDRFGFLLGCSPDGLVGDDGIIECKNRLQKYHAKMIVECLEQGKSPSEHLIQVQSQMLILEREWVDLVQTCPGTPAPIIRIYPDPVAQEAIIAAATAFEEKLETNLALCRTLLGSSKHQFIRIERQSPQAFDIFGEVTSGEDAA